MSGIDGGSELLRFREEIAATREWAYLNHAGVSALPRRAVERMRQVAEAVAAGGDQGWLERMREVERVRGLAARLLGARSEGEVSFVENTSTGLSMIAQGFPWQAGDNVVGAELEFPSNVYPWMQLADFGVEYRRVPEREGRIDLDELISRMDGRTRMVVLSWVQYASGFRADLARLAAACRERGALLVSDVIQGLGALRLDVERDGVDVAVASGHKWLLGPEGIGVLYVADRVLDRFRPNRSGWRSMREQFRWTEFEIDWAEGARRFESGTLNVYGITALGGSLDLLLEAGMEAVEGRVLALADRAARGLAERGFSVVSSRRPGETSGIVTATHPSHDANGLARRLADRGILVAARAGRFRVSAHFYNTDEEIDRMLEAVGP